MKPNFVALPYLTSHPTFYECSRSILCKPQDSPQSPLTRLGVIISYSLHLERKITLPSIKESFRPTFTPSQVTKQYDTYTASTVKKTTTAIIGVKIDKSLEFQVNRLNIARDTSIKAWPKIHPKIEFFIPSVTLTLINLYKTLFQLQHEHPYQHSQNTNG